MRLWLSKDDDGALRRQKELMHAAETAQPRQKQMANTGAKGFASIFKARQAKILEEFSNLADEVNNTFDEQEKLIDQGKSAAKQMKADAAELRAALGLQNDQ